MEMNTAEPPQTPLTPVSPGITEANLSETDLATSFSSATTLVEGIVLASSDAHKVPRVELAGTKPCGGASDLLRRRCEHLARHLAPLLSIETGDAHPRFPRTMLQFHLLSEAELDELAQFYHQRTANEFSMQYPMPVVSRWGADPAFGDLDAVDEFDTRFTSALGCEPTQMEDLLIQSRLNCKRRRFGRFIGLQGMDSAGTDKEGTMREDMERWVEREMQAKEHREREREVWRSKGF